jgi:hypothetical protein
VPTPCQGLKPHHVHKDCIRVGTGLTRRCCRLSALYLEGEYPPSCQRGVEGANHADAWADTTSPHGRLMLTVLGGLAEFERELIRARTGEGRERAKGRAESGVGPPRRIAMSASMSALGAKQKCFEWGESGAITDAMSKMTRTRLEGGRGWGSSRGLNLIDRFG